MIYRHAPELKQALIAVFATAASMGVDIDELAEQAAAYLAEEELAEGFEQFKSGAVREIRHCRDLVNGIDLTDESHRVQIAAFVGT